MKKIDFKKELKHLYRPSARDVAIVDVPAMNYLMIDGEGDPNNAQAYQDAIGVLYPLSYTLKFMIKRSDIAVDYGVMPLEGLWWADDMTSFSVDNKDDWKWTLMIMQPVLVTESMVLDAIEQVKEKKNPTALPLVRFETFNEGRLHKYFMSAHFQMKARQ